jgi:hypothetical protein
MESGWDGAWLDITAPSFYNMVDAQNTDLDGITRFPYNTVDREDYTIWTRAAHHDLKIGRIQTAVLASQGRLPVLAANNNGGGKWFDDGGDARRFAENNASKVQGIDGVTLEAPFTGPSNVAPFYTYSGLSTWKKNVRTVADATNDGLAVLPWLKMVESGDLIPEGTTGALGYGWASLLIGWGSHPGETRVVVDLWTGDANGRHIELPDFLYYDLGEPLGEAPATDDALKSLLAGASTYRRDWSRGVVLVNPSDSDDEVSVTGYMDPETCLPATITAMPEHSYRILVLPQVCAG